MLESIMDQVNFKVIEVVCSYQQTRCIRPDDASVACRHACQLIFVHSSKPSENDLINLDNPDADDDHRSSQLFT